MKATEKVINFFKQAISFIENEGYTFAESDREAFIKRVAPTLSLDEYFIDENWQALGFTPEYASREFECSEIWNERYNAEVEFDNMTSDDIVGASYKKALSRYLEAKVFAAYREGGVKFAA